MSLNRHILRTLIIVGLSSLLPKTAMVLRDLLIAGHFGRGDQVDAFLVALSLPSLMVQIIVQAFASGLIPIFIHLREEEGIESARSLSVRAGTCGLICLSIIAIFMWLLGPWITELASPGFSSEKQQTTLQYYNILVPLVVFQGAVIIWSALLNANGHFALTSLIPAFTPVCVLGSLSVPLFAPSMEGVVFATLGGACLEALAAGLLMRRQGLSLWQWGGHPRLKDILLQALPMVLGMALGNANIMVDQICASMLGSGSVSALTFGNKVPAFLLSLAALPLGTAILPHFSHYAARQDWKSLQGALTLWATAVFVISLLVSGVGIYVSEWIVRMLFERGQFSVEDTASVAAVQAFYLLQIPGHMVGLLCSKMLNSMKLNRLLLYISFLAFINNIGFDLLFMKIYGLPGIALSTSMVYSVSMVVILSVLFYKLRKMAC